MVCARALSAAIPVGATVACTDPDNSTPLAAYLNQVFYGRHAYGVEAASETYFSKSASKLNLSQAALLAGLPQAPTAYDPFAHPAAALQLARPLVDRLRHSSRSGARFGLLVANVSVGYDLPQLRPLNEYTLLHGGKVARTEQRLQMVT